MEVSDRFAQIANVLTSKIAELLYAPVVVTDDRGTVITSSQPAYFSSGFNQFDFKQGLENSLRIPLRHESEFGEVIVGESLNQRPISDQLAHALVELVIHQTALQDGSTAQHRQKDQLIQDLLLGRIEDEAIVLSRAKRLRIDLNPPRAVILVDAANYILQGSSIEEVNGKDNSKAGYSAAIEQERAQVIINSIVSFFHLPNETICADLGQGKVCVLKASDSKNLSLWTGDSDVPKRLDSSWANLLALKRAATALRLRLQKDTDSEISIGIGRYHPGLEGLSRSYEDARAALTLGSRLQASNSVHCLAELGIASFVGVSDEVTKIELAKYLLSPLDHEPELLATIDAFFAESCCASSTSRRLYIHRNTLSYRLDKIASLTGLDPRKFDDAVQIRLSLLLRSLNQDNS